VRRWHAVLEAHPVCSTDDSSVGLMKQKMRHCTLYAATAAAATAVTYMKRVADGF